jgi:saccharopine dehydrogenase-like NADP-dependent oxidoreductase
MAEARPAVLVIGGSGVFGAHLCRRLARLGLCRILIGGRRAENALALISELQKLDPNCAAAFVQIDRNRAQAAELKTLKLRAVVDAAGPFQASSYRLVEAAIEARIHYIDLCDARAFVSGIAAFDTRAKQADVAILTGASSTPALSNAMLRDLTAGWQSIDRITVSIVPGNKVPRGRSVIDAILSWSGEPVRVFDDGCWQTQTGWSGNQKVPLGKLGNRNAVLAETPDLDVLVEDFKPRVSARFQAGMELGLIHHSLRALAALRRLHFLPRLSLFGSLLHFAAKLLEPFGGDTGGMAVEADGINAAGTAVHGVARLIAVDGHGPVIPSLSAVAILRRMAGDDFTYRGASHAGRHVTTGEVMDLVSDLSIHLETGLTPHKTALFMRVLGQTAFASIPPITQTLHCGAPAVLGEGLADIDAPDSFAGRLISALFRFPKPGKDVPVSVLVEQTPSGERWLRLYPGRDMQSFMSNGDAENQTLEERFGPLSFRMKITGHELGLDMEMETARVGPLPLPKRLLPKIVATERSSSEGNHVFDVSISLPLIGRIVRYRGWLALR